MTFMFVLLLGLLSEIAWTSRFIRGFENPSFQLAVNLTFYQETPSDLDPDTLHEDEMSYTVSSRLNDDLIHESERPIDFSTWANPYKRLIKDLFECITGQDSIVSVIVSCTQKDAWIRTQVLSLPNAPSILTFQKTDDGEIRGSYDLSIVSQYTTCSELSWLVAKYQQATIIPTKTLLVIHCPVALIGSLQTALQREQSGDSADNLNPETTFDTEDQSTLPNSEFSIKLAENTSRIITIVAACLAVKCATVLIVTLLLRFYMSWRIRKARTRISKKRLPKTTPSFKLYVQEESIYENCRPLPSMIMPSSPRPSFPRNTVVFNRIHRPIQP